MQDVLEQKAVTPILEPIAQKNTQPPVTPVPADAEISSVPQTAEKTSITTTTAVPKTEEKAVGNTSTEKPKEEKIAEAEKETPVPDVLPVKEIGAPAAIPVESDAETKAQKERLASIEKARTQIRIWEAKRGASLKKTLQKWASEMQMEMVWHPKTDPDLNQNVLISGNFETAIKVILSQAVQNAPSYFIDKTEGRLVVE